MSKRRNICSTVVYSTGFHLWLSSKESTCDTGDTGFDLLEEEMAIHSSILAKKIPRTEEPGVLQSMGSQRARQT